MGAYFCRRGSPTTLEVNNSLPLIVPWIDGKRILPPLLSTEYLVLAIRPWTNLTPPALGLTELLCQVRQGRTTAG